MDKKIQKGNKQTIKKLSGIAAKNSANKTVSVIINYIRVHPIYKKRYIKSNKILAHTEEEIVKGQKVTITPTRPLSKKKAWKVIEVGK